MPWPRTIQVWSEQWRSAEDRLTDLEQALRQDGVPVFASCAFARWDLHARGGLLGSARLRLGLEEHGGGRQLVRIRVSPAVPLGAAASLAVVVLAAVGAELAGAWGASAVLSVIALLLAACLVRGCALAVGAFVHHVTPHAAHGARACARHSGGGDVKAHGDLSIYRRLASETRPFRLHIAAIFVLSMLAAPLALLTPVPLAIAVDSVIGSEALPGFLSAIIPSGLADSKDGILLFCALMFGAIAVLVQLQQLGNTVLKTYTGEKLVLNFRSKLFQQSQRLSLAYHDRVGTSDSTYRVQEDAKSLQYIAVESLISLVTAATTLARDDLRDGADRPRSSRLSRWPSRRLCCWRHGTSGRACAPLHGMSSGSRAVRCQSSRRS